MGRVEGGRLAREDDRVVALAHAPGDLGEADERVSVGAGALVAHGHPLVEGGLEEAAAREAAVAAAAASPATIRANSSVRRAASANAAPSATPAAASAASSHRRWDSNASASATRAPAFWGWAATTARNCSSASAAWAASYSAVPTRKRALAVGCAMRASTEASIARGPAPAASSATAYGPTAPT